MGYEDAKLGDPPFRPGRRAVSLQPNGSNLGPVSWSSKTGEWEELRACVNSTGVVDLLEIVNEDPLGGTFYVDRAELREMPVRE